MTTPSSSGKWWAETPGRVERDDANGGVRVRTFEGRYATSGTLPGGISLQQLPLRGYGYPGSSTGHKLDTVERTMNNQNATQWTAVLTYLPPTTGSWSTSGAAFVDLPRSWSIGGELLQFAETGDWYYVTGTGTNDPILGEVPAFKKIATGRLVMQEVISDISAARARAKARVNTKNNASFEDSSVGDMLYLGFEAEEFTNDDGDKRWRLRHNFLERDIPGKAKNGWEYVLRDDTAQWSYINQSPGSVDPEPIYPSSSFRGIFGAS